MKRRISITMGLSLVAVFAIIATLGLMSLNQASTVQAESTDGSVTVGPVTAPGNPQEQSDGTFRGSGQFTGRFEFAAPAELTTASVIVLDFGSKFNLAADGVDLGDIEVQSEGVDGQLADLTVNVTGANLVVSQP